MNAQDTPRRKEPQRKGRSPGRYAKCLLKGLTAALGMGLIFWLLWNWAAVPLFTFPSLSYLQGLGAVLLAAFLIWLGRRMGKCSGVDTPGHISRCHGWSHDGS